MDWFVLDVISSYPPRLLGSSSHRTLIGGICLGPTQPAEISRLRPGRSIRSSHERAPAAPIDTLSRWDSHDVSQVFINDISFLTADTNPLRDGTLCRHGPRRYERRNNNKNYRSIGGSVGSRTCFFRPFRFRQFSGANRRTLRFSRPVMSTGLWISRVLLILSRCVPTGRGLARTRGRVHSHYSPPERRGLRVDGVRTTHLATAAPVGERPRAG